MIDNSSEFLDHRFDRKNYPYGWILQGKFLRLAAKTLYDEYQKSLQYLNTYGTHAGGSKEAGAYSFDPQFEKANSDIINQHIENLTLRLPYLFLEACAIENGIKAILIFQNKNFRKISREQKWPAGGHDFTMLFKEARIALSSEQSYILTKLTDSIRWAGRYHNPLERKELKYINKPDGGKIISGYYSHGDKDIIDSLWTLLKELYYDYLESANSTRK